MIRGYVIRAGVHIYIYIYDPPPMKPGVAHAPYLAVVCCTSFLHEVTHIPAANNMSPRANTMACPN